MPGVMISCGEASGDLYAGALALELRRLDPGLRVFGMGGERLQAAGAELLADYRGISVTGLLEVVRLLPRTYALYRRLVPEARARRPEVAVLVDFPDFNFRLGRSLHALGVPVVYYVAPQLWAKYPPPASKGTNAATTTRQISVRSRIAMFALPIGVVFGASAVP